MKKILMLLLITISLFVVGSCENEDSKEVIVRRDNFSLTISSDKTKIKVGEKIKINVTFKNESDKDIPIQHTDAQTYNGGKLKDIFIFDICDKEDSHMFAEISVAVKQLAINTIDANAAITETFEYLFNEKGSFKVAVAVNFYTGDGYFNMFKLESKSINIIVS